MKIDLDECGLDPDQCCSCRKEKVSTDRYGLPWCDDHRHRGALLNWGLRHHWPDLPCPPYAIGPCEYCWYVVVVAGRDELIWMALAAIEYAEKPPLMADAPVELDVSSESPPVVREPRVPTQSRINPRDQEVDQLRKEARRLMSQMGAFFKKTNHQSSEWRSSGRMHSNGKITEKDYLNRVVNAIRVGESEVLTDAIEAMQGTLQGREERV